MGRNRKSARSLEATEIAAVTEASAALFFLYQPQGVSPFFVFRKDLRKLSRV